MIFLTSDTHFNHSNIIKYCNRPFKDVEEMNEELIKRWNKIVSENDTVYHLGDFGFSPKEELKNIFDRLNGKKILIMGNHDYRGGFNYYKDLGFDEIYKKEFVLDNKYVLTHHPVEVKDDQINFFGHIHDKPIPEEFDDGKHICVCVEQWNYKPIKLLKIEPGMYVRTEEGIKKISEYRYQPEYLNCHCIHYENEDCGIMYEDDQITNATYNIIELIEVGDYVNGYKVNRVCSDEVYCNNNMIRIKEVKSIVTKEQFEKMELIVH